MILYYQGAIMNQLITGLAIITSVGCILAFEDKQPEELGKVKWLRNYDAALKQAKAVGKPIMLVFQEVPG